MTSHHHHDPQPHPHSPTHHLEKHSIAVSNDEDADQEDPDDTYFLIPRTVTFVYGPYFQEGIMDYRTERLQGLKTLLEKHGVTVVMKQSLDNVNFVRVWFLDEPIFACQITQLAHGGDGELDPLCQEAAEALENFIKIVSRGLRETKHPGHEELKRPFCPCFHVGENGPPRGAPPPGCGCCSNQSNPKS